MNESVSPSKYIDNKLRTSATTTTTTTTTTTNITKVLHDHQYIKGRSSLERNCKSVSFPRIDTSHGIEKEKVIWQDYVSLKMTRHYSRLYCVLSQAGTLIFFDTPDDVSQSRHIISLHSVKRIRPISSPPQMFSVDIEYNKDAGGHHVEIAFARKKERSICMVLLHSKLHLRVDSNH
ncbi:hypothetical protein LSM04_003186 [Trypanosoma melophagium]|uniref:uncharacterized protein n=1 Tax=Trypanosoma melophagium TaxID=715481 RepID=UPI00351A320B|nr:hypothetical protein LSM04_003186 [Trypanosoma melophagium]